MLPRPLAALARGVARVVRHPLVDRIITGRWSIAVIAFALIGIVTLQLGLLKLNVGIGRSLEKERTLERENATLGIENAELASPERIRELAARLGMTSVALSQLRFVRDSHDPAAPERAAARLRSSVHPTGEAQDGSSSRAGGEASGAEAGTGETSSTEASTSGTEASQTSPASTTTATGSSEAPSTEAAAAATGASGGEAQAPAAAPGDTGQGG